MRTIKKRRYSINTPRNYKRLCQSSFSLEQALFFTGNENLNDEAMINGHDQSLSLVELLQADVHPVNKWLTIEACFR